MTCSYSAGVRPATEVAHHQLDIGGAAGWGLELGLAGRAAEGVLGSLDGHSARSGPVALELAACRPSTP